MKSFSAILYGRPPAVRSIGVAGAVAGGVGQHRAGHPAAGGRRDVVGEAQARDLREAAVDGRHARDTPFSSIVFSSAPLTLSVTTMFPNGSTVSDWPRVIGNGGGVYAGQKSPAMSTVGHVSRSRSPPELVIANWTPMPAYVVRIASVTTLPTSDSHVRPVRAAALVGARDGLRRRADLRCRGSAPAGR